jgi:hypothetical protein
MPRPAKSPVSRFADVKIALDKLPALLLAAAAAVDAHGYDSPQARAAFDAVEIEGATVHRQSRILAGKSRGG